jgi:hypothetical protein
MDAGMSSDSDCNSYSGLLEFNFHSSTLEKDFSKFDPSNFPNLSGIGMLPIYFDTCRIIKLKSLFFEGDDVKLEPISPLAQSPQPLSPMENVGSLVSVKSEIQVCATLLRESYNISIRIKIFTIPCTFIRIQKELCQFEKLFQSDTTFIINIFYYHLKI